MLKAVLEQMQRAARRPFAVLRFQFSVGGEAGYWRPVLDVFVVAVDDPVAACCTPAAVA